MASSRIDELRRRVQNDPASIAFAQLAEEYRRSGQTEEAVRVCQEGLTRHPGYLSARVTLGRALLDLGQLAGARDELQFVVAEAPENLAAVRGLAEIYHREGQTAEALAYYQRALALARHDPEIEEIVQQLSRQLGAAAADPSGGLSFEEAHQELLSAAERLPVTPPPEARLGRDADHGSTAPFDFDRLVAALGSPAAPPQVEAAVEGRPSGAVLDLPEPASLGPDPFAVLEAELRASDAQGAVAKAALWPGPATEVIDESAAPAPPSVDADVAMLPSLEEVLADAVLGDAHVAAGTGAEHPILHAPDVVIDPFAANENGVAVDVEAISGLHDVEAPALESRGAPGAEQEFQPETATAPQGAHALAAAERAPASEGVLDELESWLTTLQDRTSP